MDIQLNNMILKIWRFLYGYNYQWEEIERIEFTDGYKIFYICKKSGTMKVVLFGAKTQNSYKL